MTKGRKEFEQLVEIMARLRSESGCPWDKEQTHQSLRSYLIEEAYEVAEAVEKNDMAHLKEELGDVLLQVIFHSQIASEEGSFSVDDVLEDISSKLIRRHPHVFSDAKAKNAEEVVEKWEKIKSEEKEASVLQSIPRSLPALLYSFKLQKRAAKYGFDWQRIDDVFDKLDEEINELRQAHKEKGDIENEIGDILFSIVNTARYLKVEPEEALRKVANKFAGRFNYIEEKAEETGRKLSEMSLEEMDKYWEEAKLETRD